MSGKIKSYSPLLVIALLGLLLPMGFTYLKYANRDSEEDITYNKPNLTGQLISDTKPVFSKSSWFSGFYQTETDDYNNDHWAFKEIMVRWNNQMYYNLFRQIRVNGFVSGKEDYIFSEGYIFSAFGDDLIPEEDINTLLQKAKVVQDTLKAKGIDLLFVYAPGKGQYCKEYIQDKYVHPIQTTNHARFVKSSREHGVNHLDLLSYFERLKSSTPYPLFPKFGHHWSFYGACIASDTIIGTIEHLQNRDLPDVSWKEIEVTDTSRSRDADVLKSMNLLHTPAQNMKLAYPNLLFENDSAKNTTRVLTISDSYWYDQVYMGIPLNCFAGGQFWYYNNKVIPSPKPGEKVEVWQLNLKQEIESNRVIMLLYSDGNLPKFGNHFIEDAYELYTAPASYARRSETNKQIQQYAKEIRESPVLLKKATSYSEEYRITLDSAIRLNAMKMAGLIK
jgi:hypothetical protein